MLVVSRLRASGSKGRLLEAGDHFRKLFQYLNFDTLGGLNQSGN